MPSIFRSIRERFARGADPIAARQQNARDYRHVFASETGQRVLADLLRRSGVLLSTYRKGDDGTLFREGQRAVGLYIIQQLNVTEEALEGFTRSGEIGGLFDDE